MLSAGWLYPSDIHCVLLKESLNQEAQVEQLPELQPEQELLPAPGTVLGTPLILVVKAAKVDILGRAGLWHLGQSATCPA
jgi:hypothetical protein